MLLYLIATDLIATDEVSFGLNIVANLSTGIRVDSSSNAQGTVIGGTVYQGNGSTVAGAASGPSR